MNSIIQYCYYVKGKNPQGTLPLYWEPVKMVYDKVVGKIQNAKLILSLHVKKINPIRYCNLQNQPSKMSQKDVDKMQMQFGLVRT